MGAERKNPTIADLASQTRQRWLDPNVEETIHSTQTRPRSTWWFSRAVWLGFPIGFRLVSVLTVEWLSEALSWWARAAAAQGFPLLDSHRIDRRRCPESAIQAAASRAYSSTHASYIESHFCIVQCLCCSTCKLSYSDDDPIATTAIPTCSSSIHRVPSRQDMTW